MAGRAGSMFIHIFTGEPEFGVWCPNCLKPSGYRVLLYAVSMWGVKRIGWASRCYDCEAPIKGESNVQ